MAAAGDLAIQVMEDTAKRQKGEYVLIVDGAVPTADGGVYGAVGERNGKPVTLQRRVTELAAEDLDDFLRPRAYYGKLIHENCPRRASFDEGKFAKKLGDEGCLYELGCKGPITYADCPRRLWNGRTNWVIGWGAPWNSCTSPEYTY